MVGSHDALEVRATYVLEQRVRVDLLLIATSERTAMLLSDDRDDGSLVELGVVEPVEQMDSAWPVGGKAAPRLPSPFRVRGCHERGGLLMASGHEGERTVGAMQRREDRIDPVAGISEDSVDAPRLQASDESIRHERALSVAHAILLAAIGRNARSTSIRDSAEASEPRCRASGASLAQSAPPGSVSTGCTIWICLIRGSVEWRSPIGLPKTPTAHHLWDGRGVRRHSLGRTPRWSERALSTDTASTKRWPRRLRR